MRSSLKSWSAGLCLVAAVGAMGLAVSAQGAPPASLRSFCWSDA